MSSKLTFIYKSVPGALQDVLISAYGYNLMRRRYSSHYWEWLEIYKQKVYSNLKEEQKEQFEQLKQFLLFVVEHSPYYKKLYTGINIGEFRSVEDLPLLPIIDKEMLRMHMDDVYTIDEENAITSYTGGTTGKSMKVRFRSEDVQRRMAYLDAFKYKVGVDIHKLKKATFSGRSLIYRQNTKRFWRNNYPYRQRLYSTFHISEDNMPYYLKNLNKYKPEVITGFVSAIHEISQFVNRKKIRLAFTPKAVFTTSETLFPHHREAIEKAFGCKVYNQYASAEGAPFITECSEGNLHYNLDTGVIESNDNNEMIVTSFTTHGTPLVRYNIGDIIKWKEGACNCGSCHPLVESIEGRNVDYLVRQDGRKISLSHLADVIKGIPNSITKMQFIQENEDTIVVKIETDKLLFNVEHQEKMMIELRYRFGDEMNIEIREVTNIPKQKSGKYALIKNRIK